MKLAEAIEATLPGSDFVESWEPKRGLVFVECSESYTMDSFPAEYFPIELPGVTVEWFSMYSAGSYRRYEYNPTVLLLEVHAA